QELTMTRRASRMMLACGVVAAALAFSLPKMTVRLQGQAATGQRSTAKGDWPYYTADAKGSRYSPLDQINAGNFNQLEVAWRFKTDNLGPRPEYQFEGTTLIAHGAVYTTAGSRRAVVALDAATG